MLSDVAELFDGVAQAPAMDRRLTRRIADIWARAARGHFPSWAAVQQMQLGDDLDWMFVVDSERSVGFPFFIYIGDRLSRLSDVFLAEQDALGASLLDKATSDIFSAISSEAPHFREETLVLCDGVRVQIRAMTAPLADDGETITHVMGAVSGRILRDGAREFARLSEH